MAMTVAACSPALNWREVRMDKAPLRVLLPCKPDRAEREVDMGGRRVALQMLGCDADGATFAVSHAHVPRADTPVAAQLLDGWKQAVLTHVQATDVHARPWTLPGGWTAPQSLRLQAQGRRADGSAVTLQAAWFASVDTTGIHLFHAVMFAPRPRADVGETFLSGLATAP